MPGRADREFDVRAAFHMDRLDPNLERLGSIGRQIFRRIARIDGFDEKVLNVRNPRSSVPRRSNRSVQARRPGRRATWRP